MIVFDREDDDIDRANLRGGVGHLHVVKVDVSPLRIGLDVEAVARDLVVPLAAGNEGHVKPRVHQAAPIPAAKIACAHDRELHLSPLLGLMYLSLPPALSCVFPARRWRLPT